MVKLKTEKRTLETSVPIGIMGDPSLAGNGDLGSNLSSLPVKKRKVSLSLSDSSDSENEMMIGGSGHSVDDEIVNQHVMMAKMGRPRPQMPLMGHYVTDHYDVSFPRDSDLGVKSNMHEQRWERMFEMLLQVGKETGSCKIPLSYKVTQPDGTVIKLGLWLGTQRQLYRKGQLRKDKFERLQSLVDEGRLEWGEVKSSSDDSRWERVFAFLVQYGEEHGNCNVPERYNLVLETGEHIKLGRWLDRQRGHMKRNKMRSDRLKKMEDLMNRGLLIRDTQEEDEKRWNWCYEALVNYGLEHGHCNVPHSYEVKLPNNKTAKLGVWLSTQRHLRKKMGKLRSDRAHKLQELVDRNLLKWGDVQVCKDQKWELCYMALIQYDLEHGNLNMPRSHEFILGDGSKVRLFKWLQKQIIAQKMGKLKSDRLLKLQELVNEGKFSWDDRIEDELLGLRNLGRVSVMGDMDDDDDDDDDNDNDTDSEIEELAEEDVDVLLHAAHHVGSVNPHHVNVGVNPHHVNVGVNPHHVSVASHHVNGQGVSTVDHTSAMHPHHLHGLMEQVPMLLPIQHHLPLDINTTDPNQMNVNPMTVSASSPAAATASAAAAAAMVSNIRHPVNSGSSNTSTSNVAAQI